MQLDLYSLLSYFLIIFIILDIVILSKYCPAWRGINFNPIIISIFHTLQFILVSLNLLRVSHSI